MGRGVVGLPWFIIFLVKIYLHIKSKNVFIYCTTWQNGADVGILENVFCVVNGSLEDVENKMEG